MIILSVILMLIGASAIIIVALTYTIIELLEEWRYGFKKDVLFALAILIPVILIAVGAIIYAIYK